MQKKIILFLAPLLLGAAFHSFAAGGVFPGVKAVASRLDPRLAEKLVIEKLDGEGEKAFVSPADGKIRLEATSASAASFALGRYLREIAKGEVSWCGSRIPSEWPLPEAKIEFSPAVPVRFAYNYCTLSYTMAFWSKKEWREEIDRLALSGFNSALVLQGLPEVWKSALESFKDADGKRIYSDDHVKAFIADEAAEAWWHMGNLEGHGGPVPPERIAKDAELGRWLYAEMKAVGIEPALQGFVGLVPSVTASVMTNATVIGQGNWCAVKRPDVISPLTKEFDEFSAKWYEALARVYGTADNGNPKYLAGDLFHEGGNTGNLTDTDLAHAAEKIQRDQQSHFPGVTWLLQSWQGSPRQGIRNGLDPKHSLIQVLDKNMSGAGSCHANYVKHIHDENGNRTGEERIPWIWCEVLNFGGNTGMHGGARRFRTLGLIGTAPASAETFRGYGMLSEGLETNPSMYALFTDGFAAKVGSEITAAGLGDWAKAYLERRYGEAPKMLVNAQNILLATVLDCSRYQEGCVENILCADPSFNVKSVSTWGPQGGTEYEISELRPAALGYLAAARHPEFAALDTFRYDFCELFLQALGDRARAINGDLETSAEKRAEFMKLLDLAERLLASSPRWRLDWHEARTLETAGVKGREAYRRMITTWMYGYDKAQWTGLHEYAHRAYAGMIKGYYAKRWRWFFDLADSRLTKEGYRAKLKALDDTFRYEPLEPTPPGDLFAIGKEIFLFLEDTAPEEFKLKFKAENALGAVEKPKARKSSASALSPDIHFFVTAPGVTTRNGEGEGAKTLEEALELKKRYEAGNGGSSRLWVVVENEDSYDWTAAEKAGWRKEASPSGMELVK